MVNVLRLLLILLPLALAPAARAAIDFDALQERPPGEQYRQLSLLMLITGGTDPALLEMLQPVADLRAAGAAPETELELDDFVTPLIRIVDQEILLGNAAQAFRFAHENGTAIQERMTRIATDNPILVSMIDVNELASDAIIIRNAVADTIEYSSAAGDADAAGRLDAFRRQTVYLRNMMEYNQFEEELSEITDRAIVDLGGRLDAYQRMFDEEVDEDLIRRRIESARIMNEQSEERFRGEALLRNAELMMMLILMESQVH